MSGKRRLTLFGAALSLALVGCGSDEAPDDTAATGSSQTATPDTTPTPSATASATPTSSPVPADAEPCGQVWQEGAKLARGYAGCVSQGEYVDGDAITCSSGQFLLSYDDRFYGVLGGTVVAAATSPLSKDRDYRRSVRSCTA